MLYSETLDFALADSGLRQGLLSKLIEKETIILQFAVYRF